MRTIIPALFLLSQAALANDPGADAIAYCDRYRPNLELTKTCLERRIAEMTSQRQHHVDKARQAELARGRMRQDVAARTGDLLQRAVAAEIRRLIPMPIHRQRAEIARMDPAIGAIVAQRLGLAR